MTANSLRLTVFCVIVFVSLGRATQPTAAPQIVLVAAEEEAAFKEKEKDKPKPPDKDKKPIEIPKTDIFTDLPMMGAQFPTAFNPQMMGDLPGQFSRRTFTVTGFQVVTTSVANVAAPGQAVMVTTTTKAVTLNRSILVPGPSPVAFKIAENISPMPQNRAFVTYNFYGNVKGPLKGQNEPITDTSTTVSPGGGQIITTSVTTFFPPAPIPKVNIHREVFGFEKTLLNGDASIEVRLPVVQQVANPQEFSTSYVGDLTIIAKYAFLINRETGNVLSGGFGVTTPNGPGSNTPDGYIHSWLLQPWIGALYNFDRFYVMGFNSMVFPTDSRDQALMFTDLGIYFWLYRTADADRRLRFVVPLIEAHATTPLNHVDLKNPLGLPDLVVMTGGFHLGLRRNATFSFGVATPVTGPRIFHIEAFAQYNRRF